MKKGVVLVFGMVLLPAVFIATGSAWGSEQEAEKDTYKLKEMVVTATRHQENVNKVPANISVITETDISNSTAKDVADLLRTEAGLNVKDVTGGGRNYSVDLRGFGETAALNTLVLVDGRRTNQADLSGVDWAQIPLARVERIEILRGGRASALYGDNAAGGVINIITKKGSEFATGGEIQVGSYDAYKASAYVRGSQNSWKYAVSGSYKDSQGYRENSDNQVKDFGADFGYGVGDNLFFNLSSGYHEDRAGLPGAIKESEFDAGVMRTDSVNPDNYADYEDYYLKGGPEFHFLSDSMVKMDVSYRKRDTGSFADFAGGYFNADTGIDTVTVTPQMVLKETLFCLENSLSAGVDYTDAQEAIANTSEYYGWLSTGWFDLVKKDVGYYLHDEIMITPALSFSGGYRYDTAEYGFDSSLPIAGSDHADMDEELVTAAVNYSINSKSNMYFSYARSYRYPVLDELFNFFMNQVDSTLMPQTADDFEAGLRYAVSDNTALGLNLFHITTEDEIFYNPDTYSNINMGGETIRQGIEVKADQAFGWGEINIHYTYTSAEIDGGDHDGSIIPDVPEHQAGFNTTIAYWKPFVFVVNGRYMGERAFISDWSNAFENQEEYFVMNAKIKYAWKMATIFVDINNLLNEAYSEYGVLGGYPLERAYYPSPKTNFLVGISFNL